MIGFTLIAIGATFLLTGISRPNSSVPLDKRDLCKGVILVVMAYPLTYLLWEIYDYIYNANGFGVKDEFWVKLGYSLLGYYWLLELIPAFIFVVGCIFIYSSKSVNVPNSKE